MLSTIEGIHESNAYKGQHLIGVWGSKNHFPLNLGVRQFKMFMCIGMAMDELK